MSNSGTGAAPSERAAQPEPSAEAVAREIAIKFTHGFTHEEAVDELLAHTREAVEREREACAAIADDYKRQNLAWAIRARSTGDQP